MIDILCAQTFNSGIPRGCRRRSRRRAVAHKTGEISTVTHDAGIVFLPGRPPYVLAVLTETPSELPSASSRSPASRRARSTRVARPAPGWNGCDV